MTGVEAVRIQNSPTALYLQSPDRSSTLRLPLWGCRDNGVTCGGSVPGLTGSSNYTMTLQNIHSEYRQREDRTLKPVYIDSSTHIHYTVTSLCQCIAVFMPFPINWANHVDPARKYITNRVLFVHLSISTHKLGCLFRDTSEQSQENETPGRPGFSFTPGAMNLAIGSKSHPAGPYFANLPRLETLFLFLKTLEGPPRLLAYGIRLGANYSMRYLT